MSDCVKRLHEIQREYTKLSKKQGLIAAGIGGWIKNGKISEVAITFETDKVLFINTARQAIVDAAFLLLKVVNKNPAYQSCFNTDKPIENYIDIAILGRTASNPYSDYISAVLLLNGTVYYDKIDPEGKINPYIHIHRESFQEAVAILNQSL